MGMKLHSRYFPVRNAHNELASWLLDWMERHDLTWIEAIMCLTEIAHDWMRYPLRRERHPDEPEKKADEE